MAQVTSQKEINDILWQACDTFRGTLDPTQYKDYILVMLFIKYLTDLWKDKREHYRRRYQGDERRVERALGRERFIMPIVELKDDEGNLEESFPASFDRPLQAAPAIQHRRTDQHHPGNDRGRQQGQAGERLPKHRLQLRTEPGSGPRTGTGRLNHLLDDFANSQLDLRPSRIGDEDIIGNAYEYLIGRFAADAGKKGGEFYTPGEVAMLLARMLNASPGDTICDPACGSGSLLIRVAKNVSSNDFALFGQESNGSTWALCPDEHVPARDGQRPHRVVQLHHQPPPGRRRPTQEIQRRRGQSALQPQEVGAGRRPERPLQTLLARNSAQEPG